MDSFSISLCRATSTQDQVSLPLETISTMPVLRRPFRDSVHLTPGTLELLLVLRYGTKRVKSGRVFAVIDIGTFSKIRYL